MSAPIAITADDLQLFLLLAVSCGLLGGFFYAAARDAFHALCYLVDQRRRERAFLADLAELPTGDRWHG